MPAPVNIFFYPGETEIKRNLNGIARHVSRNVDKYLVRVDSCGSEQNVVDVLRLLQKHEL